MEILLYLFFTIPSLLICDRFRKKDHTFPWVFMGFLSVVPMMNFLAFCFLGYCLMLDIREKNDGS